MMTKKKMFVFDIEYAGKDEEKIKPNKQLVKIAKIMSPDKIVKIKDLFTAFSDQHYASGWCNRSIYSGTLYPSKYKIRADWWTYRQCFTVCSDDVVHGFGSKIAFAELCCSLKT